MTNVTGSGLTINYNNANITYLDISRNANFYGSANLQNLTNLETLVMHHCTNFDYWGTPGNYMSSLKYVDVSYCTNMDRIFLPAAQTSKCLKLQACPNSKVSVSKSILDEFTKQYCIVLKHNLTTLKWLDVSGCSQLSTILSALLYQSATLECIGHPSDWFLGLRRFE